MTKKPVSSRSAAAAEMGAGFAKGFFQPCSLGKAQGKSCDHGISASHSVDCLDLWKRSPGTHLLFPQQGTRPRPGIPQPPRRPFSCTAFAASMMSSMWSQRFTGQHPDLVNVGFDHRGAGLDTHGQKFPAGVQDHRLYRRLLQSLPDADMPFHPGLWARCRDMVTTSRLFHQTPEFFGKGLKFFLLSR